MVFSFAPFPTSLELLTQCCGVNSLNRYDKEWPVKLWSSLCCRNTDSGVNIQQDQRKSLECQNARSTNDHVSSSTKVGQFKLGCGNKINHWLWFLKISSFLFLKLNHSSLPVESQVQYPLKMLGSKLKSMMNLSAYQRKAIYLLLFAVETSCWMYGTCLVDKDQEGFSFRNCMQHVKLISVSFLDT